MDNIVVNPNIDSSIKNVNHLYPIDTALSRKLVEVNYHIDTDDNSDTVEDLRDLFFKGGNDPRLESVGSSKYSYSNYDENNIDKIPTTTSYGEFRKIVDQINDSAEYKRKTNLVDYYNNIVFGDFVVGCYSGVITEIDKNELKEIANKNQLVQSYIPGLYRFLHVINAPADLCAYINIRGILFKMNKISDTSNSTEFEFQYPAFLLEQYNDLSNNVLNISFNKKKTELTGMKMYGAKNAGNPNLTPTYFSGLNYFKKF